MLQVTDVVAPILELPPWVAKLVLLLLAIGLPVALILAWSFELTPEGIKREAESEPDSGTGPDGRSRLDYVIVGALLIALGYFAWQHDWGKSPAKVAAGDIRAIIVLPFEDLTSDPEQAYFVAGMHESLISALSKIESLRIISRTSARRFKNSSLSVTEIANEAGVDAVVEGAVIRAGNTVRVSVRLIEGVTDRNLWNEHFDRELSDILSLYSEVTQQIARKIRVTLTPDEKIGISASRVVDPQAYELYLKGRYLCDNWSSEEMARGIELLQESISIEPQSAVSHAELSLCLQYAAFFGLVSPQDIYGSSRMAAATAVQLDSQLAEAHVAQAGVLYYFEFQPKLALQALDTALDLNPASVKALLHSSWLLGESGRFAEGLERNLRAVKLDPLSTSVNHAIAQLYYLNRDYEKTIEQGKRALELDPSDPSLHYLLAWPYEQLGRYDEAIARHKRAIELAGNSPRYQASLAHTYAVAGRGSEASRILESLENEPNASPYDIAIIYLGLGQSEAAIDWLEKAYKARDSQLIYIYQGPRFDSLRDEPRFIRLLERMDWPERDEPLIVSMTGRVRDSNYSSLAAMTNRKTRPLFAFNRPNNMLVVDGRLYELRRRVRRAVCSQGAELKRQSNAIPCPELGQAAV
jgi:TolB-like protein/Flp pilus assembly protein TadD